jgi:hypothetical protein
MPNQGISMRLLAGVVGLILVGSGAVVTAADQPQAIASAGRWEMQDHLPGVSGRKCTARIKGDQVDTMLMLNKAGTPLLVVGRPDWAELLGDAEAGLAIDGAAPDAVKASLFNNLVMTLVTDDALLQRLRRANTLDWSLPFGHFHATVTGLGVAIDALAVCEKKSAI